MSIMNITNPLEEKAKNAYEEIEKEVADKISEFYQANYKIYMNYGDFLTTDSFFNEQVKMFLGRIIRKNKDLIPYLIELLLLSIEEKIKDKEKDNVLVETKRSLKNLLQTYNLSMLKRMQTLQTLQNKEKKLVKLCEVIKIIYQVCEGGKNKELESDDKKFPLYKFVKSELEKLKVEDFRKEYPSEEEQGNVLIIENSSPSSNNKLTYNENDNILCSQLEEKISLKPNIGVQKIKSSSTRNKKVFYPLNSISTTESYTKRSHAQPEDLMMKLKHCKKLREIKGDEQVKEFDENLLLPFFTISATHNVHNHIDIDIIQTESKNTSYFNPASKQPKPMLSYTDNEKMEEESGIFYRRKSSIVFKDIPAEDLKLIRERDLTPVLKRRHDMEDIEEVDLDYTENDKIKSFSRSKKPDVKSKHLHENECKFTTEIGESVKKSPNNPDGKYHIHTDEKAVIKLPNNFKTNDYDLKLLCDLINEKKESGWKEVYIQNNLSIYRKNVKGQPTILIRTFATIDNFSREEVFRAIADVNVRKNWDKVFSEFKIIETNDKEGKEFLYMSIKSPSVFVADRDFVQQRKIWSDFPDKKSTILHFKSVDHPLAPEKPKFVRAHTVISGYYIQTISVSPPKTFISIISQTDIKGNIPKFIVNTVSQKAPKEWLNNLINGCKIAKCGK